MDCETLSIIKVNDVYEIHFCGFIVTATFDPLGIISTSGKTIRDEDDGFVYQQNENYIMSCSVNDGILLDIIPNDRKNYYASLTLNDQTLHVDIFDFFETFHHEYDVEVEYRNNRTKSARTR